MLMTKVLTRTRNGRNYFFICKTVKLLFTVITVLDFTFLFPLGSTVGETGRPHRRIKKKIYISERN